MQETLGALGWRSGETVEMLLPDRSPMQIFPMWLQGWVSLCEKAVYSWLDDRARTMGAAIAYYTYLVLRLGQTID
jgi:hypothetical protein